MIKMLFCLIWGHKRTQDVFTGEYGEVSTALHPNPIKVPVMRRELAEVCPRCGKRLLKAQGEERT